LDRVFPSVRGYPGQYPAAALLVHKAARAINRIGQHAPPRLSLGSPPWQSDLPLGNTLRNQDDRFPAGNPLFKETYQERIADSVNRVDGIANSILGDFRQLLLGRDLASGYQDATDFFVNRSHRLQQPTRISHILDLPGNVARFVEKDS
jgi:hypothetical protein